MVAARARDQGGHRERNADPQGGDGQAVRMERLGHAADRYKLKFQKGVTNGAWVFRGVRLSVLLVLWFMGHIGFMGVLVFPMKPGWYGAACGTIRTCTHG